MTISRNDAQQLYHENVVEMDKNLYIVLDIPINNNDEPLLRLQSLHDSRIVEVEANPEIVRCPSKYRLGYVQMSMSNNAAYLSRSPRRQYAMGWSRHSVSGFPSFSTLLKGSKQFLNNLAGEFPSFEASLELVAKQGVNVAFDKQFAIRNCGNYILYRGEAWLRLRKGKVEPVPGISEDIVRIFNEAKEKKK